MERVFLMVMMLAVVIGCSDKSRASLTGPSDADASSGSKAAVGLSNISGEAVLGFDFSDLTIQAGEEIVVEVVIENVNNLFGASYTVDFDRNFLQFVKIEEGGFLKSKNPTWLASTVNDDGLVVGLTSLGKVQGVSGTGVLARITFKALKRGEAGLSFKNTSFLDPSLPGETDQDWLKRSIPLSSRGATIFIK